MAEKVGSRIQSEIGQIDYLLATYDDLLQRVQQGTPDLVEMTAIASVLHSFYNGLENIFLNIAKGLDSKVPAGNQWHRDLLLQMTQTTPNRNAVLTLETAYHLADYLAFRHFYRHSYSFFLDWSEMGKLVISLAEVWKKTKYEFELFLNTLAK